MAHERKVMLAHELNSRDSKGLTRSLGTLLCFFANKVCPAYDTCELPREEAAWAR